MSWNFRKAGTLRDALKASVQSESAPQNIKDEVCARVDSEFNVAACDNELPSTKIVVAESYGHFDEQGNRLYRGMDTMLIRVYTIPVINTPLVRD